MEKFIAIIINNFPAIASGILIIVFSGYITWRISQKTKKREAIDKFRNAFIEEREKIKTFKITSSKKELFLKSEDICFSGKDSA